MKSSKKSYNKTLKKYLNGDNVPMFPELKGKQLEPINIPTLDMNKTIDFTNQSNLNAKDEDQETSNRTIDPYSLVTMGLAGISTGLNYNADLQNKQDLYQSIQNRQSEPLYDYNYMYGRTGTEYQPIVKAEMGAQINKRYNTPNPVNNVEIEGGEFLQLPDMSTEMAYGPSHSNGGIQTSLPEGTRVFSNHLKPMGSKKTFAQMAKKYDNTEYNKIIDNKFAKQVDKDTAMLMREKNQKILDKLFMDQQLMNGNSNGESMARNGASINNAGFKALPADVQQKILSNMAYGGYSLPNPLFMQEGAWYTEDQWNTAIQSQPVQNQQPNSIFPSWYNQGFLNNGITQSGQITNPFAQANQQDQPAQTNIPNSNSENWYATEQWDNTMQSQQSNNQSPQKASNKSGTTLGEIISNNQGDKKGMNLYTKSNTTQGGISPTGKSVYANAKSVQDYVAPWMNIIPNTLDMTEGEFQSSVYDYALKNDPQSIVNMWTEYGLTNKGKTDKELMALTKNGKFDPKNLTPENLAKLKKAYVDNKLGARTLVPSDVQPEVQNQNANTFVENKNAPNFGRELPAKKEQPKTADFQSAKGKESGKYYRQPFPIDQAIPGVLGLAASQEMFPYAIPEVDAPYISPQTLNIQSQLQDIDNMGQASVRAGADPLSAYIAGIGGKEKAFQTKQNFDAQGRMQADMFNAQAKQQADYINAQMFDRTYNNLIGQARDAQTAEQQAALTSISNNYAKYNQDENLKQLYLDNLQSAFEIGKDRPFSFTLDPNGRPVFTYTDLPASTTEAEQTKTSTAKKSTSKTTKKSSK